jgi:hypothetical protein
MTEQNKKDGTIVDVVSEARYQATFSLRKLFDTLDLRELHGFIPVLNVMQQLPSELLDEVGTRIVEDFFKEENLDPTNRADRDVAAPFSPMLATSITTAFQALHQSMQQMEAQRQKSVQKLTRGVLGL